MQTGNERKIHRDVNRHCRPARPPESFLNDVHARLNASRPALYRRPNSVHEVSAVLEQARRRGIPVAIAGGRHAMGGQQFRDGGCVLDLRGLNRILAFDREQGLITVEAGATWPELMRGYLARQASTGPDTQWGIRQKQTGADNLTIGGALAANIHGRGLTCPPFSADIVSFHLITASGEHLVCSREREPEVFSLVVGGYGLMGVVVAVTMRLVPSMAAAVFGVGVGADSLPRVAAAANLGRRLDGSDYKRPQPRKWADVGGELPGPAALKCLRAHLRLDHAGAPRDHCGAASAFGY
jgi:FAD/FMN-containing dehydrogenase